MFLRRTIPAFVAVSLALALTGCAKGPQLMSITITPGTGVQSVPAGQTAQYTAVGTFKQSTHPAFTQDVTDKVVWVTGAPGIASTPVVETINGLPVAVTNAVSAGTATISASDGAVTASSDLIVTIPTSGGGGVNRDLISVAVTPATQTLNIPGQTAQFIAIGTFSSTPTSVNLTSTAIWTSSNPTVANFVTPTSPGLITVTPTGCPTGICTTTVTATGTDQNNDQVVGQATLVVTAATSSQRALTSLAIIPSTQTLNSLGQTAQFIAIGTYNSSPTTVDLTQTATWSSSDAAVATVCTLPLTNATCVNPNAPPANLGPGQATATGCAAAAASCVATITAEVTDPVSGQVTGSTALTVSPGAPAAQHTLTNITIYPGTGSQTLYAANDTAQFIAIGTYSTGPQVTQDITNEVEWSSAAVGIATINLSGLATAVNCTSINFPPTCTTVITATCSPQNTVCQCGNPNSCQVTSAIVGTSNLTVEIGGINPSQLPSLGVYTVGAGAGTVTSTSAAGVNCTTGSASGCTGYFAGPTVTLTATPSGTSTFGGWSNNCIPATATTCTVQMDETVGGQTIPANQTVGAIFN